MKKTIIKKINPKKIVISSMLAALICVATLIVQIPIPGGGYINAGDAFILLGAFVLGPVYGGLSAGIGASVADLIAFPAYAPGTFIIKFLMAFSLGFIYKKTSVKLYRLLALLCSEIIMILGYFVYESLFFGLGAGAVVSIPFNGIQGIFGAVIGFLLIKLFENNKSLSALTKM